MKKNSTIKQVVAIGIGIALFVALTEVSIPIGIPNTSLQPRMAVMAFLAAIFGPLAGAVIGFVGHALGDAVFYGSVWWSWVIPDAIVGGAIGAFAKFYAVEDGGFTGKKIVAFNVVQVIANAVAWILIAPLLDILIYAEPANKVFLQGVWAFLGDIIIVGVLGSILLAAYSKIGGKSSGLKKED